MSEHIAASELVTFLFTDVEGSTRLWEADPRAMSIALARHDAALQHAIDGAGGTVFKTAGDAFCAVFAAPAAAITAAVAGQRALANEASAAHAPLSVRMAIHTGVAELRGGDYFGQPLNRVARLLATAHGGQIVLSRAASELAREQLAPTLALRDLGEHSLKDLQHPERVFQVVAPELRHEFPPLRTPRRLLRNVPRPATPLIGREKESAQAAALLGLQLPGDAVTPGCSEDRQPARLLTLTGPGGAGKTRLALHLASELGMAFGDGAVFVPLATVSDPDLAPAAILAALELDELTGETPRDLLFAHLRDRHLLLILDNLEQVTDVAPLVADVLSACPRIVILTTSRERLHVRGEQELPLPPLAVPPQALNAAAQFAAAKSGDAAVPDDIRGSAAVRLFLERARSAKPDFDLTVENAAAVAEICRRLDGLPLAIELAAARARFLAPQALLDRLDRFDRRLDVLSRGSRDLPPRQQTMRDTVAWSVNLLDPAEQRLFARLAVFVGGATFEACAAVAGDAPGDDGQGDPFELLESLNEKSLVQLSDAGAETRIAMFETIRDFGLELLAAGADGQTTGQRHAEWYLALAESSEPHLAGSEQSRTLDLLEQDHANLRAAIGWLREHGQSASALRLAAALWRFWWLRGDAAEGRGHLDALLSATSDAAPAIRAKALNAAGVLAESQGDLDTAEQRHQESLRLSRSLDDQQGVAWSLNNLGVVAIDRGDLALAQTLLEENLALAERCGDPSATATALMDLGQLAHHQGDPGRARSLFSRSLEIFRDLENESFVARALNNLGGVLLELGEFAEAHTLLSESLALHRHVGDRQGIASTLNNLAGAANHLGDVSTAMGYFRESHRLALEGGNRLYAAIAMENLARLTQHSGNEGIARNRFQEALRLYQSVGDDQGINACKDSLAAFATATQGHEL